MYQFTFNNVIGNFIFFYLSLPSQFQFLFIPLPFNFLVHLKKIYFTWIILSPLASSPTSGVSMKVLDSVSL